MFALCAVPGYRDTAHLGGARLEAVVAALKAAACSLAQRGGAQTGTAGGSCEQ